MQEPEPDESSSLHGERLAEMLTIGSEADQPWGSEDLRAVLAHQLSAPIAVELGGLDDKLARELRMVTHAQNLVLKSFGDLLQHPNPPLQLLVLVKDFAKANQSAPESALPKEVAIVLYFAAIAAALVRCRRQISQLPKTKLAHGFRWAVDKTWVDSSTRRLVQEALRILSGNPA